MHSILVVAALSVRTHERALLPWKWLTDEAHIWKDSWWDQHGFVYVTLPEGMNSMDADQSEQAPRRGWHMAYEVITESESSNRLPKRGLSPDLDPQRLVRRKQSHPAHDANAVDGDGEGERGQDRGTGGCLEDPLDRWYRDGSYKTHRTCELSSREWSIMNGGKFESVRDCVSLATLPSYSDIFRTVCTLPGMLQG